MALFQIRQQMLESGDEILAPGLGGALDHFRIGEGVIGGRCGIQELPRIERHPLAVVLLHPSVSRTRSCIHSEVSRWARRR